MKVYIPHKSDKKGIGGGYTFYRNFVKGVKTADTDIALVDNWKDADIVFIVGATITDRDEMREAKDAGKWIVFRIDNIPKDSRNRGTAFSRVLDFAKMADVIVFQSGWACEYVEWWLEQNGVDCLGKSEVISNGVDTDMYYNEDNGRPENRYLVVASSTDENKRIPEAFYRFHQAYRKDQSSELWVVGKFQKESIEYNFDFFAGEDVKYLGLVEDPYELGNIMRQCSYLIFPSFADACPNVVAEAAACGCEPIWLNGEGGSLEVKEKFWDRENVYSIQDMVVDYHNVFPIGDYE